jgi:hypothetical protein
LASHVPLFFIAYDVPEPIAISLWVHFQDRANVKGRVR